MKPKHRHDAPKTHRPALPQHQQTLVFPAEALAILQSSLQALDGVFKRQGGIPNPCVPFALETFMEVQHKVVAMLHTPGELFPFDANEILVLRTALLIYAVDLAFLSLTPEREYLMAMCQAVSEQLPKSPVAPPRLRD